MRGSKFSVATLLLIAAFASAAVAATATVEKQAVPPTLLVGMVWSMSGAYSPYGHPAVNGVLLAINEINKSGGIKVHGTRYNLKLKVLDDRSDPQTGVA